MIRRIYSIIVLSACLLCVLVAASAQNAVEAEQNTEAAVSGDTVSSDEDLVSAPAQEEMNGEALAARADSAYSADNFTLAEQLYKAAMAAEGTSAPLFYNLGNAYYRQGNLGMALVNYERALKIDPTMNDARVNLEFVKTKITDRQIDSGSIMTTLSDNITGFFKADTWAWIAVVLFAIFLAGACTYLFSSVVMVKKVSFFGGIIVFFLCAGAVIVSFAAANRVDNNDFAIILSPAAQLSTSPREARTQAEEAFLLHEGTKVEIVDSVSGTADGAWYEVKVGHERAWIKASDVERI